ncbi:hypothetical protein MKW92_052401 [Papaver armeniacum]|nr:hypothetical protein MKW92_052401 [Papaver armeniacum]
MNQVWQMYSLRPSPEEQKVEKAVSSRCDSQVSILTLFSSLTHSSVHLSDDDLEDFGDSRLTNCCKGEEFSLSEKEHDFSLAVEGKTNNMQLSSGLSRIMKTCRRKKNTMRMIVTSKKMKFKKAMMKSWLVISSLLVSWKRRKVLLEDLRVGLDDAKKQILETRRLFVRNLPFTARMVRKILRRFLVNLVTSQRCIMLLIEIPIDQKEWLRFSILPEFALRAFEELDNSNFQGRLMHILPAKEQNTVRDGPYLEGAPGSILSPGSTSEADAQKYGVVGENNVKRAIIEQGWKKFLELMLILIEWSHEKIKGGRIQSAKVKKHLKNGKNVLMGFGSIELNSVEAATKVYRDLQGTILDGHALSLQHCNAIIVHVQPMMPAVSSGVCQREVPSVWPFLGPSLIPSPVPAIEVGSIQMPIPIHSQMGSSVCVSHIPLNFAFSSVSIFCSALVPTHYSFNQNQESSVNIPASQGPKPSNQTLEYISQYSKPGEVAVLAGGQDQENEVLISHSRAPNSILPDSESRPKSLVQDLRQHDMAVKNNMQLTIMNQKREEVYIKNSGSRSLFPVSEAPHSDLSGFHKAPRQIFQRTVFRVRENVAKRHTESVGSSENSGMYERLNFSGRISGRSVESVGVKSDSSGSHVADSERKTEKQPGKESTAKRLTSSLNASDTGEGNPRRNSSVVEDVDVPMQSGIVRIFRQTGIEAPSDEDDYIETSREPCYVSSQNPRSPVYSNKPSTPLVAEAAICIPSTSLVSDGKAPSSVEWYLHLKIPLKSNSILGISNSRTNLAPGSSLANKSIAMPAYFGSWGSARINQQVCDYYLLFFADTFRSCKFFNAINCGSGNHQSTSQLRGEESLSIALPADLSVETPCMSFWPPLPSPSSQMLYNLSGSGPLGGWHPCLPSLIPFMAVSSIILCSWWLFMPLFLFFLGNIVVVINFVWRGSTAHIPPLNHPSVPPSILILVGSRFNESDSDESVELEKSNKKISASVGRVIASCSFKNRLNK